MNCDDRQNVYILHKQLFFHFCENYFVKFPEYTSLMTIKNYGHGLIPFMKNLPKKKQILKNFITF